MYLGTQDKDFFPKDINAKLDYVKNDGFDCYEIDGKLLVENTSEVKKAIADSGVKVLTACGGYRGWIGDFIEERRENAVADISLMLEKLAEIGGTGIVVPAAWGMFTYRLPPMVSPRSKEGDRKALIKSLSVLDKVASEYGQYIYLEPLNRYQDHMLNTTAEGVSIIKEGGFKNVKITADFYHMSIEEDNLSQSLIDNRDYIGHVHVAENHRYQPGTGTVDFTREFATLKSIGYDAAIVIECRVRGDNPAEEYRKSEEYLRSCWAKA